MVYNRDDQRTDKTFYGVKSGTQTTLDSEFTHGDLAYARENGLIDRGFIINDDAFWRLDDDGNWPGVF